MPTSVRQSSAEIEHSRIFNINRPNDDIAEEEGTGATTRRGVAWCYSRAADAISTHQPAKLGRAAEEYFYRGRFSTFKLLHSYRNLILDRSEVDAPAKTFIIVFPCGTTTCCQSRLQSLFTGWSPFKWHEYQIDLPLRLTVPLLTNIRYTDQDFKLLQEIIIDNK